mgnify:CR=1 FL=1
MKKAKIFKLYTADDQENYEPIVAKDFKSLIENGMKTSFLFPKKR